MPLIKMLQTIAKTTAKTMRENRRDFSPDWKYKLLTTPKNNKAKLFQNSEFPFLRSSAELKKLMFDSLKSGNKENVSKIVQHIRFHKAGDIESYKIILKTIKKNFKDIDISDLF